jgi:membrane glycosyltransferase
MKIWAGNRTADVLALRGLAMRDQDLRAPFTDSNAPPALREKLTVGHFLLSVAPVLLCVLLLHLLSKTLHETQSTMSLGVIFLHVLVVVPFYWDAVAATIAALGPFWKSQHLTNAPSPMRIAILVLLYDERPEPIIERADRLLSSLPGSSVHQFSLYILSDSRDSFSIQREQAVFKALKSRRLTFDMHYLHRPENFDFKSGNIRSWIRSAGHLHDAMLVLDADSIMEADSAIAMADELSSDPACALVQSIPSVLPGQTRWQAMQAFSSRTYGYNMGRGLSYIAGGAANFYGHNALVRIAAFATSAGLPHLEGDAPFGGVIMSHDFVEAALLRRAGWRVRFKPDVVGSFEGTPQTLTGYLARDRRWCHGNLQHLRLLRVPGLAFMSRFHMLQGAMTYISAPLWLGGLLLWATVQPQTRLESLHWPIAMIVAILLLPRAFGLWSDAKMRSVDKLFFALKELVLSSLLTPVLMFRRTHFVVSIFFGRSSAWISAEQHDVSFISLARFHALEMFLGALLTAGWSMGVMSTMILTAALPLLCAPALAYFVSRNVNKEKALHENR